MCTGVGECRKMQGGTMCPSFKATRDEEHSTRGRANALRLAMSNQLDNGLTNDEVVDALDLCLSCKACKSECPSNVDMGKLKGEVWQKKYDEKGIPLRDRFAGIEKDRILPAYATQPFYKWFAKHYHPKQGVAKKVVLFADTYLNFHEPNIGIAATELLQSLGYEVILANVGCCQRPKISHGFLRDAKREGTKTVQKLDKYLQEGLTVVVCEPSCASALTDDLPDLIDDDGLAKRLKAQVKMIDVFILEEIEQGNIKKELQAKAKNIFVHGHCHQKAIYGTKAMKNLLSNNKVSEIPSGCCGMAGSFGYEKEHYELSKKIGAEILFPFINDNMKDGDALVACGFSCRHQIEHFTGKKAVHWVELF